MLYRSYVNRTISHIFIIKSEIYVTESEILWRQTHAEKSLTKVLGTMKKTIKHDGYQLWQKTTANPLKQEKHKTEDEERLALGFRTTTIGGDRFSIWWIKERFEIRVLHVLAYTVLLLVQPNATSIRRLRAFQYGLLAWNKLHRITWLSCDNSVFLSNNEQEKDCKSEHHWFWARIIHCLSKLDF